MALAVTSPSLEPRSFSIGPVKLQILNLAAASGDVSGSFVVPSLANVTSVTVTGLVLTAQPTFSGNTVTLAFSDPGKTVAGAVLAFGK